MPKTVSHMDKLMSAIKKTKPPADKVVSLKKRIEKLEKELRDAESVARSVDELLVMERALIVIPYLVAVWEKRMPNVKPGQHVDIKGLDLSGLFSDRLVKAIDAFAKLSGFTLEKNSYRGRMSDMHWKANNFFTSGWSNAIYYDSYNPREEHGGRGDFINFYVPKTLENWCYRIEDMRPYNECVKRLTPLWKEDEIKTKQKEIEKKEKELVALKKK